MPSDGKGLQQPRKGNRKQVQQAHGAVVATSGAALPAPAHKLTNAGDEHRRLAGWARHASARAGSPSFVIAVITVKTVAGNCLSGHMHLTTLTAGGWHLEVSMICTVNTSSTGDSSAELKEPTGHAR